MDIYVYSGRGNSYETAKLIAARFPDAHLLSASNAARSPVITVGNESAIGLVFPTIDMGIPLSIRSLIARISCDGGAPYVFAAVSNGGMPAGVLHQADRLLRRRGLHISAGILLPYTKKPEDAAIRAERLTVLCDALRGRYEIRIEPASLFNRAILTGAGNALARRIMTREDRSFAASESCAGCGNCARLCPAGNISIEEGKPRWGGRCEQCGACFAWCPRSAISGACLAAKTRFTNPNVSLEEMLALSNP